VINSIYSISYQIDREMEREREIERRDITYTEGERKEERKRGEMERKD
jgi:hypothetical protein